jgi:hypothetical protein
VYLIDDLGGLVLAGTADFRSMRLVT